MTYTHSLSRTRIPPWIGRPKYGRLPTVIEKDERPPRGFRGTLLIKRRDVRQMYYLGSFWYQFKNRRGTSEVHLCDNRGEMEWLAESVAKGARLIVTFSSRPKQD